MLTVRSTKEKTAMQVSSGQQQSFTAVDQTGTRRPDATWTVSDPAIASFVSGSPNTLQGVAAGQVTLTATVGSASGQTTVTVLSGTSLSAGTVLWSANPVPGFTAQKIIQAVPTAGGPDLYSIETDSSSDVLIRASKAMASSSGRPRSRETSRTDLISTICLRWATILAASCFPTLSIPT